METSPEFSRRSASLFAVPVAWPFQEKPEKPEKPTCIGVPRRGFKQDLKDFFVSKAKVNLLHQKRGEKNTVFWSEVFSAPQISKRKQFIQGFPYTNPSKMPKYLWIFFFLRKSMDFNDSKKKVSGFEPQNSGRAEGF